MPRDPMVTLKLPSLFVGQLLDGLDVLIEDWENTAEYHQTGFADVGVCVREATDAREAGKIAALYQEIRDAIAKQLSGETTT